MEARVRPDRKNATSAFQEEEDKCQERRAVGEKRNEDFGGRGTEIHVKFEGGGHLRCCEDGCPELSSREEPRGAQQTQSSLGLGECALRGPVKGKELQQSHDKSARDKDL